MSSVRPLFGGAMEMFVPPQFVDVSDLRVVPDHQEVFTDVDTGCCIIVELNSYRRDVEDAEAPRYYFEDIAKFNESSENTLESCGDLSDADCPHFPSASKVFGLGVQSVSKYREHAKNDVLLALAIVRLVPPTATDIVVSVTSPLRVSAESSEARAVRTLLSREDLRLLLQKLTQTLKVLDMSLFVPEV